jgi:pyruvate dehydrogenase kinase 2/3/4
MKSSGQNLVLTLYGLPISRSHCRYFGDDLDIMSLEGYGIDAYVYLKHLLNGREPLFV